MNYNLPRECVGSNLCGVDGTCFTQISGQGFCTEPKKINPEKFIHNEPAFHVAKEAEKWMMKAEELEKQLLHYAINVLPDKDAQLDRLEALLSKVKSEFDSDGITRETLDEIEFLINK